ncbi:SnoaL-like domain protein [Vibrio aerogenes CECT 7868]|uniref:SnoaL-like domain protein n=1 Tax=Vibrio aerogenes CECT 7868 TaxID=1216006 RepID=A0A1M5VLB5_9VIBR|nr:nuclear transport factor 2 family protein [Vibrio aerogenes]SHH75703.1 SnoaL-like domain protein [Vibrio aerogenes CECT 7868]
MDVQFFAETYQKLNASTLALLAEIYHPEVVFEDPAHRVQGLDSLEQYFQHLFENVTGCHFYIKEQFQQQDIGFVTWKMVFIHTKLNKGQPVEVHGVSQIQFSDGLVKYHRDYFDLGSMLYEHVPLVGWAVRQLKQRLSQ